MAKTKKTLAPSTAAKPRADMNGWVLCPGDGVLIISPGEEYHGLFAKVDAFPTTLELSSFVQIDGRPTSVGRVLIPNAQLRWSGPGLDQLDQMRPTRPGQRVRVVLDNESLATAEMKALDGQLGEVMELGPISGNNVSMITVKFDDASLLPASVYNYDLLIVPTPVVEYVPEPVVAPAPKKEASFQDIVDGTVSIAAGLRMVPLASIVVTTNTRKVFDETALAELAESVKAYGILQPIVLRPHGTEAGQYELVAGGRRYRAAQMVSFTEVPATVRTLTDREFLEVQLLENLQRVDVRPADEAQAFAELLKNGFPLEEIAAKVGKPARFVAERARLMELLPEWVEALQQGRLLIGSAQQLARLTHAQQAEAHQYLDTTYYGDKVEVSGVMRRLYSAADIRQHIERQFKTHDLEQAAFPKDDATLYPVAGACLTCPKRTGNTPYLFDEMGGNTCLDGSCFGEKVTRYVARMSEQLATDGQPVLKVADHWGRTPSDVLNLNKHKSVERLTEVELTQLREAGRVRPALMTEGARAGHIVEIVLDAAVASQPDVVAAIKEEKAKQTQKEKDAAAQVRALGAARRQAYYQLTADVHGEGLYTAVLLRRMLYKKLEYHSHGSLRELLKKVYGWSEFKGGTYLDERERQRVLGYLAEMDIEKLHALMLDIQLLSWLEEEHPSTLPALSKELGWSDEQLLAAHAERRKGKKQEVAA